MHKQTKPPSEPVAIDVLLFASFSNHCLANTLEPFRAANAISGETLYKWRFLSLGGGLVTSSSGMSIETQIASVSSSNYLMVISSYGFRALTRRDILRALRGLSTGVDYVIGLDTGAWLMAAAGLLDAKSATIHGDVFDEFVEEFSQVTGRKDRFVIDGNSITCGGAMAAFDLVLDIIKKSYGEVLRLDVAALFLHQTKVKSDENGGDIVRSDLVSGALHLMDDNIEDPLTITDLARRLGCDPKALHRRFIAELDSTPGQMYRHKQLSAVRRLVESTNLSVSEIAVRGGYQNASAMTRAFKAKYNTTPMALRAV